MSTDPQAASNPAHDIPVSVLDDRLTFPPFPQPPPGVTIIPFKDFKERGIQMFATGEEDDVERDGLGIPTVELRVRHNTDACKTDTKRKRKPKAGPTGSSAPRKEWWEVWMENEDLKMTGPYNPHISALDRLYEAAADFKKMRAWPGGALGIAAIWDQFRLFVGLLSNTPVWTRTDKLQQESDTDSDSNDEAEFEEQKTAELDAQSERKPGPGKFQPRPRARPPYALYGVEPIPVSSDEEVRHLLNSENARREEQMVEFLNDPEEKLKIFLSSYIRKQGLVWHDPNLVNIPRLLGFFIRFLIRNRVFPEIEFDKALQRSLAVIELAQKELILTSKIAKQIPDDFHRACRACWGQKADGYKPIPAVEPEKKPDSEQPRDLAGGEPDAKRPKLDTEHGEAAKRDDAQAAVDRFEAELKAANVEVIKVDDDLMKDAEKLQVIKDNLNPDIDALPTWAKSDDWPRASNDAGSGWGRSDSGWGNGPEGWGTNTDGDAAPSWGTNDSADPDPWAPIPVDWGPPVVHSLLPMLGPTALPLTHTGGIVECSVRRVKSFAAPPAPGTLPKSPVVASGEEDPDAVDVELERRFAKVVLAPWPGWDRASDEMPHMAQPRILETSRGPIRGVVKADGRVEPLPAGTEPEPVQEGVIPHDPFNDDITLLVEPELVPLLSPKLGVGGTFVQIARGQDFASAGDKKKKKKKAKSKKSSTRYWYIEELLLTLPSYHT
ncbi:hypothetical protein LshimejAT787_0111210 [Lyophyllum shimeji]|uniref:Uncharacterized protein n=1 Tax=Lyophyllum shimeji TaxID=47721 RepID=A0A9P3PE51_LYOSH|nr:hypothetical protein LshimejAT787_0111210 [Lyophyllum shimeji]